MKSRIALCAGVLIVVFAHAATTGAEPAGSTAAPMKSTAPAKSTTPARVPAPRKASARVSAAPGKTAQPAAARSGGGPRRLEDIHIEGEIPAPQVLFISARDQRRFVESRHRHYLRTARQVGESTVQPSSIVVTRAAGTPPR